MDERTDFMKEGEVMGTLSLNENYIRNSQRLRRRTSSIASSRSQSGSPIKSGNRISKFFFILFRFSPLLYLSVCFFSPHLSTLNIYSCFDYLPRTCASFDVFIFVILSSFPTCTILYHVGLYNRLLSSFYYASFIPNFLCSNTMY